MNNVAVLHYICLHALQIQNVKRNVAKTASINELDLSNTGLRETSNVEERGETSNVEERNTTSIDDLPSENKVEPNK